MTHDDDPNAPCPVPLERSVAALRAEGERLGPLLGDADPTLPTRLGDWTLRDLTGHMIRGMERIGTYLDETGPITAEVSWLGYWRAVRDADRDAIAQRGRDHGALLADVDLGSAWGAVWPEQLDRLLVAPPERVLPTPFGAARLDHYATTRAFEVTVHALDVFAALGHDEVVSAPGLEVVTAILDGLLDGPRPEDLDGREYVLAATGRRDHDDDRLPLIT